MQWLRARISRQPRAAQALGKAVFLVGAILILAAVFARIALISINSERLQARQPAFTQLAQAYPQLPTWLVPEGPVGYAVSALLVLAGMAVTVWAAQALEGRGGKR